MYIMGGQLSTLIAYARLCILLGMSVTPELSAALSKVVRKHRLAKGISMLKLAEMAGIDKTYPGKFERGMRSPSVDVANAIAKALGLRLSQLIGEAEKLRKL